MLKTWKRTFQKRVLSGICAGGMMLQLGGCEIGEITTTTTLDGRELLISLVRGAILAPIDVLITDAINDAFGSND